MSFPLKNNEISNLPLESKKKIKVSFKGILVLFFWFCCYFLVWLGVV